MTPKTLAYPLPTTELEIGTIKLTSPLLRIGGAVQTLSPFEYVQSSNRVYIPHADLLARALDQRRLLNDYIDRINRCKYETYDDRIDCHREIRKFLKDIFGDDWVNIKTQDNRSLFPTQLQKWTDNQITDLRPMIRNGMGQLYIPGSSIKGAIRTAIVYHLVKHRDKFNTPKAQQPSALELEIRKRMEEHDFSRNKWKQGSLDDRILIDPLFTDYKFIYQGHSIDPRQGPNTDFMRAIKVSDAAPLLPKTLTSKAGKTRQDNVGIAAEVHVSSHFQDDKAKYRATIYAEMVRNANTTFTIRLDRELLSWFQHQQGMKLPFNSIDDILKICQEFAQDQWDEEHDYWVNIANNPHKDHQLDFDDIRDLYAPETCPYKLRLGWGTGMNGTTIGLSLPNDLRQELRDRCGIAAPGFEAPKSRRTVTNHNGGQYALGWVKLEMVK